MSGSFGNFLLSAKPRAKNAKNRERAGIENYSGSRSDLVVRESGIIGQIAEGEGGAGGAVHGLLLAGDLVIEAGLFEGPDAELAPAGDGHGFDEGVFDGGGGLELVVEVAEELREQGLVLALEDDRGGEQAVTAGVHGSPAFAFGRDRPAGFRAIAAGSLDLFREFSSYFHFNWFTPKNLFF